MPTTQASRRGFFVTLAAGGAAAAVATAAVVTGQRKLLPAITSGTAAGDAPQGYRETEHIRSYYRSTRI